MVYATIISPDELAQQLNKLDWIIVDCRFSLADTEAGRRAYRQGHIPSAVYAHLDEDLSGPPLTDHGRHPLPSPAAMAALFGRLGIDGDKQVVAYDDASGAIAARLWWMLHYMGHRAAAVLDGGWPAWEAAGLPGHSGPETNPPAHFNGRPQEEQLVTLGEVPSLALLVDSRAPERYRGEVELIDPVAGHIPGAVNYHYGYNLDEAGRFLSPAALHKSLREVLGTRVAEEAVFYCGSGVTACHNLLALRHAGLGNGRLYAGSWSEWVRDAERPVARGEA